MSGPSGLLSMQQAQGEGSARGAPGGKVLL